MSEVTEDRAGVFGPFAFCEGREDETCEDICEANGRDNMSSQLSGGMRRDNAQEERERRESLANKCVPKAIGRGRRWTVMRQRSDNPRNRMPEYDPHAPTSGPQGSFTLPAHQQHSPRSPLQSARSNSPQVSCSSSTVKRSFSAASVIFPEQVPPLVPCRRMHSSPSASSHELASPALSCQVRVVGPRSPIRERSSSPVHEPFDGDLARTMSPNARTPVLKTRPTVHFMPVSPTTVRVPSPQSPQRAESRQVGCAPLSRMSSEQKDERLKALYSDAPPIWQLLMSRSCDGLPDSHLSRPTKESLQKTSPRHYTSARAGSPTGRAPANGQRRVAMRSFHPTSRPISPQPTGHTRLPPKTSQLMAPRAASPMWGPPRAASPARPQAQSPARAQVAAQTQPMPAKADDASFREVRAPHAKLARGGC